MPGWRNEISLVRAAAGFADKQCIAFVCASRGNNSAAIIVTFGIDIWIDIFTAAGCAHMACIAVLGAGRRISFRCPMMFFCCLILIKLPEELRPSLYIVSVLIPALLPGYPSCKIYGIWKQCAVGIRYIVVIHKCPERRVICRISPVAIGNIWVKESVSSDKLLRNHKKYCIHADIHFVIELLYLARNGVNGIYSGNYSGSIIKNLFGYIYTRIFWNLARHDSDKRIFNHILEFSGVTQHKLLFRSFHTLELFLKSLDQFAAGKILNGHGFFYIAVYRSLGHRAKSQDICLYFIDGQRRIIEISGKQFILDIIRNIHLWKIGFIYKPEKLFCIVRRELWHVSDKDIALWGCFFQATAQIIKS